MKQYLELAEQVLNKGTFKPAAREGMPSTISLFGAQFRHDLSEGFPLLTTKKINFKNVVTELLWFMRGDINIKYLIDNDCNIWNEDAYNYYLKIHDNKSKLFDFETFIQKIKEGNKSYYSVSDYTLGDCGKQYGWLWRNWEYGVKSHGVNAVYYSTDSIDQLQELIEGLKNNPMSRRHIITAWNPATLNEMALNACHSFVQFNCRPIPFHEVGRLLGKETLELTTDNINLINKEWEDSDLPRYYLDCQLFQRSADLMLGVPYNIASYSLLIHIISKITNMIPGEFVHTFGDVHIYENHLDQIKEQLTRTPTELPKLTFSDWFENSVNEKHFDNDLDEWVDSLKPEDFQLENYNPQSPIKAKLSTGLK